MQVDSLLVQTAGYFLALLFLVSGLHKAFDWRAFVATVDSYQLLPKLWRQGLAQAVALLLTLSEFTLALWLVIQPSSPWPGLMAAGLLTLYAAVMGLSLYRGHTNLHCGCSFSHRQTPLSFWHLLRNAVLILLSLSLCLPQTARVPDSLDMAQALVAALCLGVLYLVVDSLLANRRYIVEEVH